MRILILNPILYTAESNAIPTVSSIKDTMIYNLCLGFKQLGHDITLAAAMEYQPCKKEEYDLKILFFKSDLKRIFPPSVLPFSRDLWKHLKQNSQQYDLIISSEVFSFQSLFASLLYPRKTIVWHELALHPRKLHKLPSKIWYNCIAPLFMRKILVVPRSEAAYDFIKRYHKKTTTECIEHGVNIEKFAVSAEKKDFFIVISQLIERKNISSIITKFAALIKDKQYKDFKLYVIGQGPLEEQLKRQSIISDTQNNIIFTGFLPHVQMSEYTAHAKALLINTYQDNNMVSIPETLSCGTPVISNTVPTNSYIINSHQLGIAKDNWDEHDLKEIIANNSFYVKNCIAYRDNLANSHIAQTFLDIFQDKKIAENIK